VLAADWALFTALGQQIQHATDALAALLPQTPAGVLLDIPGVGVLTASSYGAAIGDPSRYRDAAAAYRASGLVPVTYEPAGHARARIGISREGSVELRRAIVNLGRGIGLHHPDFISYRHQLLSCGKPPLVAMIAVGHRAHRLAFIMMRSQRPYDANRWARAVAGRRYPPTSRPAMAAPNRTLRSLPTGSATMAGARTDVDVAIRHDLEAKKQTPGPSPLRERESRYLSPNRHHAGIEHP
jgi:hypothetical protein